MSAVRNTRWIFLALAVVAASGCVMTSGSLTSSAERLERSAVELSDEAREDRAGGGLERDAQEFASEARDFRRVVEDSRSDDDDVREAFRELSERYHALRDEVEESDSSAAEIEFKSVTEAYLDIEREIRSGRERLASD